MKKRSLGQRSLSIFLTCVLVAGLFMAMPLTASAAPLPENSSDVGVYTNGASDVRDIGSPPAYNATYKSQVEAALAPGVAWTADSMYDSIFEKDKAAGGTDYYLDRVLGVSGNLGSAVLMTRGRSLYIRGASTANFTTMGFSGNAYAGGGSAIGSNLYTVTLANTSGTTQTLTEVAANRFNAPSHAKASLTVGTTGVRADMKKFITFDNVAVTTINLVNTGASAQTLSVRAQSAVATAKVDGVDNELTGTVALRNNANNGLVATTWSQATVGLKAKGFAANAAGNRLDRNVTIPAGESVEVSVVGVLYSEDLPASKQSFYDYAELDPVTAFKTGVTAFNERWAKDIPYINVPDPAVEKAIVYRWWGERYNSLDTNESGYTYQFPVTIEGVNLYQNAIVLTQPMHLQDTKWQRTPYLAYGQLLNVGELSGSSAFLDSPGHGSWNNHYSQYLGTAGLEAYYVHGGGADIAKKFAYYFESDGKGQLAHYDGNKNNLIAYTANYMPGNDADALTFGFSKSNTGGGGTNIERPESAYVWGDFDAASKLYTIAGADSAKITEMNDYAKAIKDAILGNLWNPEMKMFLARTTRNATVAATANGNPNPLTDRTYIPARESNLYDVYAQNLIDPADYAKYVDGFRFLTYGDNHPIFPFYTANQYDKTRYNIGGSNNFSNINFTVQYRAVRSALRYYDPNQKYLDKEYAAQLLDWMAWSIYPSGDLRVPNQAEYYSNWNATNKTYNRNNPNHIMLGNMNYIYVEDIGGILPRADDKIELWPIDFGYDNFMVNNLRYHGKDITIVWDKDGSKYGLGQGYSLFIDGVKKVSVDKLGKFTYDPNTNTVDAEAGLTVTKDTTGTTFSTAVNTPISDARVVDYLKKAGIDKTMTAENLALNATATASFTQTGTRPAAWRSFHTPGMTGQMNYDPGSIATSEMPASVAAVNDGVTVNEPYWGNYGTTNGKDWVELDFGSNKTFDNVGVYFYNDGQTTGSYVPPQSFVIKVPDGAGWKAIPTQSRASKQIKGKLNDIVFDDVTASKLRVEVTNRPGSFTAITELQVFDSDKTPWAMVNEAPNASLAVNANKAGNNSTELVATVSDDGLPFDASYSYEWALVSAPAGATARIVTPADTRTMVLGSAPGAYVFKFTVGDGEETAEKTISVTLAAKAMLAEFGANATISSTGQASWENQSMVNAASTPASQNPGTGQGWGNWGTTANGTGTGTREAWLKYTWATPITASQTQIYWYDDNGGTRVPTATTYRIEYSMDNVNWFEPTFTNANAYAAGVATPLNAYKTFDFATPITAKYMRIRIFGVQGSGAGTGVLRWRVNGSAIESVDEPVLMRVVEGNLPNLPANVGVTFADGSRGELPFVWDAVTPDMVATTNVEPFSIFGVNSAYNLYAEARVYVRPEDSVGGISITNVVAYDKTINLGQKFELPTKVEVAYNDGSRDNQAHNVTWDFDPNILLVAGDYTVMGDVSVPAYVSPTTEKAQFRLKVEASASEKLTLLGRTLAEMNAVDRTPYTPKSVTPFAIAIEDGLAVMFNAGATDAQIDAATAAVNTAFGALKFRLAADSFWLDILRLFLDQFENDFTEDDYTPSSWAPFQKALDDANAILTTPGEYSEADIDVVVDALFDTSDALVRVADKRSLKMSIDYAENLLKPANVGKYIPASVANLEDALSAAAIVYGDADTTQAKVDAANDDLLAAIGRVYEKGDKSGLQALVTLVSRYAPASYTPASWAAFTKALDDARKEIADPNAIAESVSKANTALTTAITGLTRKADVAALSASIVLAEGIVANIGDYVPSTVVGLAEELAAAKVVADNPNVTQAQVNAAAAALGAKILAVRLKPDLSGLLSATARAKAVEESLYTPASYKVLTTAVTEAEAILRAPDEATQDDVDDATVAVYGAIATLVAKPVATAAGDDGKDVAKTAIPKVKVSKVTASAKAKLVVKWAKAPAAAKITGYQIQYRVKGTSKWKTRTISAKSASLTIKSLKKNKKYQIRIRAYRSDSVTTQYGAWSVVKISKRVK